MKKYIEILKYSLKTKLTFITDYLFSLISFGLIMFVFNELWEYILQGKLIVGYTKTQLIWYITITEFITFSSYRSYIRISDMVKNGDIANMLVKPVDFVKYIFFEDLSVFLKTAINAIFAVVLGLVLTGPINVTFLGILYTIIGVVIGVITGILIQILMGMIAFFTEENRGFWLITQKLTFMLIFTPLEFYPQIVQKIFACLPTTYMVYSPAKIFIDFDINMANKLLGLEILAGIIIYILIRALYAKGVKKINVNGG